jgi:hypothetical protein
MNKRRSVNAPIPEVPEREELTVVETGNPS